MYRPIIIYVTANLLSSSRVKSLLERGTSGTASVSVSPAGLSLDFPVSFPLIARDKENGISNGKAVTVRERQVVRSRKHRKQQSEQKQSAKQLVKAWQGEILMNVEWELGKKLLLADLCLEPKLTFS